MSAERTFRSRKNRFDRTAEYATGKLSSQKAFLWRRASRKAHSHHSSKDGVVECAFFHSRFHTGSGCVMIRASRSGNNEREKH